MATKGNTTLTQSSMGTLQACPTMYDLRINQGYVPLDRPITLKVGSAFHKGVEAFRVHGTWDTFEVGVVLNELEPDQRCVVRVMLEVYARKHAGETWCYEAVEKQMSCANAFEGVDVRGVIDAIVTTMNGERFIVETKTTARIDGTYLESLWYKRQTLMYSWMDGDVDGVVYDIIQKPTIRRLKATPEDKRKYNKDGDLNRKQREHDESDGEFMERLRSWYRDHPEALHREKIVHTEDQIAAFRNDLSDIASLLKHFEAKGSWPRNLNACFAYGRPCEFAQYCQSDRNPMILDSYYKKRDDVHPELEEEDGNT